MRALYMMSCVFCLVVAIPAAAITLNPNQITNFDHTTCDSLPGTQVWSKEIGACVCSSDSNPFFEPRAAKGEGRCLPETVWSEYQEVFGPTEPIELTSSNRPVSSDHPQTYHADADNDGYSDEWDENDTDPSMSPAVVVNVSHVSEPTPPPPTLAVEPAPESVPPAEETVESDTSDEDAVVAAEREAEAAELARAKAEREAREAERQAELERREREAAAEREAERLRAEEASVMTERERELELDDDEDYFAEDDDDDTFDPEFGVKMVSAEEAEEVPNPGEGIDYDYGYHAGGSGEEADPLLDIDADKDGDGVNNLDDVCPDVSAPGTTDGCPMRPEPLVARDDDADANVELAPVPEYEPKPVALPDLDDGPVTPTETSAERKTRLKTERDERREEQRLERAVEQERKRQEREAEQARKERERKLDDYANRLASLEWDKGHVSYKRYQGNESIDTDSDGLPDDMDLCPTEPEDFDHLVDDSGHFLPLDGCPDDETGFIRLSWDGDGDDKRFFDLKPTFADNWERLDQEFWFHEDGSYTNSTMELLRELALILEAYDLKVEVKGRSPGAEDTEEKFTNRQIVGGWSRLMAKELISQCKETGLADCDGRVYDSAATGYSGIKHNTIIIGLVTH